MTGSELKPMDQSVQLNHYNLKQSRRLAKNEVTKYKGKTMERLAEIKFIKHIGQIIGEIKLVYLVRKARFKLGILLCVKDKIGLWWNTDLFTRLILIPKVFMSLFK